MVFFIDEARSRPPPLLTNVNNKMVFFNEGFPNKPNCPSFKLLREIDPISSNFLYIYSKQHHCKNCKSVVKCGTFFGDTLYMYVAIDLIRTCICIYRIFCAHIMILMKLKTLLRPLTSLHISLCSIIDITVAKLEEN